MGITEELYKQFREDALARGGFEAAKLDEQKRQEDEDAERAQRVQARAAVEALEAEVEVKRKAEAEAERQRAVEENLGALREYARESFAGTDAEFEEAWPEMRISIAARVATGELDVEELVMRKQVGKDTLAHFQERYRL